MLKQDKEKRKEFVEKCRKAKKMIELLKRRPLPRRIREMRFTI